MLCVAAMQAQEVSQRLGVPLSCVVPVKNYSRELELELEQNCDILLLSAVNQMLRSADDYFDDVSDEFPEDNAITDEFSDSDD